MIWTFLSFAVVIVSFHCAFVLSADDRCDADLQSILHDESNDLVSHGFFRSYLSSTIPSSYSKNKATAENYASFRNTNYLSKYASIRSSNNINMEYHNYYTADRIKLQDQIIDLLLDTSCDGTLVSDGNGDQMRWMIFMGGAPGVGKTYFRNEIHRVCDHCIPEIKSENAVIISADIIRPLLPEYGLYDVEIKSEKQQQIELLGKEIGLICELLLWAALDDTQSTKHIVFDSSLRHTQWFQWLMPSIKDQYPSIQLAIIGLKPLSTQQLKSQVSKRNQESDRFTEWKFVEGVMADIERSMFQLKPLVDLAVNVTNPGIPITSVGALKHFPIEIYYKERGEDGGETEREIKQQTLYNVARRDRGSLLSIVLVDSEPDRQWLMMLAVIMAIFAVIAHLLCVADH